MILKSIIGYLIIGFVCSLLVNKMNKEETTCLGFCLLVTLGWFPIMIFCLITAIVYKNL